MFCLLLFKTTRRTPSTRASIAMDGGVADTACYMYTQTVNRREARERVWPRFATVDP
jgi:hypothetical protein